MSEKGQMPTHKRQKIQDSTRTMFIWVASMAAVVGLCSVVAWFVFEQAAFKIKVVSKKNDTVKTLRSNNDAVQKLKENIRVLETNAALGSAKMNDGENALQVVLDALPAEPNTLALGGSLQERLVKGINGLRLESLSVEPTSSGLTTGQTSKTGSGSSIAFTLTVTSTDVNALNEMLARFERSIRIIDIDNLTLERSERQYTMAIKAHAYYEPARVIELEEKVVKP